MASVGYVCSFTNNLSCSIGYVEKATKAYVKVAKEFDKILKGLDQKK